MFRKKFCTLTFLVLLCASLFAMTACEQVPADPPLEMQQSGTLDGVKISIDSFAVKHLEFVDKDKHAQRPLDGAENMAVITLRVKNDSKEPKKYYPLHHAPQGELTLQLSSMPELNVKAKDFKGRIPISQFRLQDGIFTTSQVQDTAGVDLAPGEEIVDEYLFKKPANNNDLLLLVPGSIVGASSEDSLHFKVNGLTEVPKLKPVNMGMPFTIDKVSITVTSIEDVYAELEQLKPTKELKYPYAYTTDVVLKVGIEIQNNSANSIFYTPGHLENTGLGISLENAVNQQVSMNRAKMPDGVVPKGQLKTRQVEIKAGTSFKDYFFFERPVFENGDLKFYLSAHLVGLKGLYKFLIPYNRVEPKMPNFEPWKAPTEEELAAAAAAEEGAAAEGEEGAAEEAPAAEAPTPAAE